MQELFNTYINELPILFNKLVEMLPVQPTDLTNNVPLKGIYLFSENDTHLYIGRSNHIKRRIQYHCRLSSDHNKATFAFRIAREKTEFKKATYKTQGSRKNIEADPIFKSVFIEAKERIRNMELRFVEINDPILQALFEIYASMVLKTPFNDFENH